MSLRSKMKGVRGAAYTELLALMPGLIVINMALLHLWNAYAAKQWTMYESRHGAWTPSMTGCQGAQVAGKAQKTGAPPDSSLESLQGQVAVAKQEATAPNIRAPFEQLTRQATGAQASGKGWNVQSDFGGFQSSTYQSKGAVLCNEVPKTISAGDEKQAVDSAYQKYVGM